MSNESRDFKMLRYVIILVSQMNIIRNYYGLARSRRRLESVLMSDSRGLIGYVWTRLESRPDTALGAFLRGCVSLNRGCPLN